MGADFGAWLQVDGGQGRQEAGESEAFGCVWRLGAAAVTTAWPPGAGVPLR
ncbi:hypothetical protein BJY14_001069 [Actinomadura luteofluorescens]|uniref:Uncharacterized protein n=1 Tax=Actinomadura luteofluorescens TaxID=46163 RepID=A0A7Y9EC81_9ACTN|nr:hypothetical protein [Actinomadura luteofluorescens]